MPKKKGSGIFLLVILLYLSISSCSFFQPTNDPMEIVVKGTSFSLAWDDSSMLIPDNPEKSAVFKVYYRNRGGSAWIFLVELPANEENPVLTVTNDDLAYGIYEFGVSALTVSGAESEIHASTESTAEPTCGWYVNWIESE